MIFKKKNKYRSACTCKHTCIYMYLLLITEMTEKYVRHTCREYIGFQKKIQSRTLLTEVTEHAIN